MGNQLGRQQLKGGHAYEAFFEIEKRMLYFVWKQIISRSSYLETIKIYKIIVYMIFFG